MRFEDFLIPQTLDEAREALEALGGKGYAVAGGTAFQYVSDRPGATAVVLLPFCYPERALTRGTPCFEVCSCP